MKRSKCFA